MALERAVISVVSNGSSTQDITHSGSWQPKAAIFQWSRANTSADTFQEHASIGYGFTDGTNQRAVAYTTEDNAARGDAARIQNNAALICTLNPSGTVETIDAVATFNSWLSNGIRINWTDQPAANFYFTVILLGGSDITNVTVGTLATGTGTGDVSYSSAAYQADWGMFLSAGTATENSPVTSAFLSLGMATGASGNVNQWVQSVYTSDNPVTMVTAQYYSHIKLVTSHTNTAPDGYATFSGFNSTGFTINVGDAFPASHNIYFLIIKGGSYTVGNSTEIGSVTTQEITTGADVKAVGIFGVDLGTADTVTDGCMWTSGWGDGTTQALEVFEDTDAVADSIVVSRHDTNQIYLNITAAATASSSTLDDEAALSAIGATSFTLNWTNIGQARPFRYVTFGDSGLTSVTKTLTTRYDITSLVTKQLTTRYDIISLVTKQLTLRYDIAPTITPVMTQVVRFQKDSSGTTNATQDVALNFTPKAIMVFSDGSTADNSVSAHYQIITGFSDGTNHACNAGVSEDGQTASDTAKTIHSDSVFARIQESISTPTVVSRATCSFGTDKVTFTWAVNDTDATYITLVAFGGSDITHAKVNTVQVGRNTVGAQDYTGLGFTPTAGNSILFTTGNQFAATGPVTIATSGLGAAVSATNRFVTSTLSEQAADPTDTWRIHRTNACLHIWGSTGVNEGYADFNSWITDGFRLDWDDACGSTAYLFSYLVIKGGTWDVGSLTSPTSAQSQNTTVSVSSRILRGLVMSGTGVTTVNSPTTINTMTAGVTDATNESVVAAIDEDGQTDSDSYRVNETTGNVVRLLTTDGANQNVAAFTSFGTNQFTLNWTTASAAQYYGWVAVADGEGLTAITKQLTLRYNLEQEIIKQLTLRYDILQAVAAKSVTLRYDVTALVEKTLTLIHNISQEITKQLTTRYDIAQEITKQLTLLYNIQNEVTKSLTIPYNIEQEITKSLTILYNLEQTIEKALTIRYDIEPEGLTAVEKALTIRYDIQQAIEKALTLLYDITVRVDTVPLTLRYDIAKLVEKINTLRYDITALAEKTLTLRYDIAQEIPKPLALRYDIASLVEKPLTARYDILAETIKSLTLRYDITQQALKTLITRYDIEELESDVNVQVVRFQKDSSGTPNATQDIALTFTPKAIIVFSDGNSVDNSVSAHYQWIQGFSDGTNHACISAVSEDGVVGSSDTCKSHRNDSVFIRLLEAYSTITVQSRATCAFGQDKVTFTWVENDTAATYITMVAYGGPAITDAKVATVDVAKSGTGLQSYTGLGFDPTGNGESILFTLMNGSTASGESDDLRASFGAAVSDTGRFVNVVRSIDNSSPETASVRIIRNDSCLYASTGAVVGYADFDSWITDGFQLDWVDDAPATNLDFSYLVINGGRWDCGTLSSPATPQSQNTTVNAASNTVRGLLIAGTGQTTFNASTVNNTIAVGATDGTTESAIGLIDETSQTTSDSYRINQAAGNVVRKILTDGSEAATASFTSFGTNQFTLNWTTTSALNKFGWVAVADSATLFEVVKQLALRYDITTLTEKQLTLRYDILQQIVKTLILRHQIETDIAQYITDRGYAQPLRCKIQFVARGTPATVYYTYDSFTPASRPFNLLNLDIRLAQGEIGTFTLSIEDSAGLVDKSKIGLGVKVIIDVKKEVGTEWQRIITGFVRRIRPERPATGALIYEITGYGSQVIFNERIVNFKRAAKRTDIMSPDPLPTDIRMQAHNLFRDLVSATDILPIRKPPLTDTGNFTSLEGISSDVTDFIAQIAPGLTDAAAVANAIAEITGSIWGTDEYGNPYFRYPTSKHSGIIIKDVPESTDSALDTSINLAPFDFDDSIDTTEGFANRLYVLNAVDTKSTASSSGSSGSTTLSLRWIAQQFTATDNNITGAAFILSKIGEPTTEKNTIYGFLRADLDGYPRGPTLASFEITFDQINTAKSTIFVNDLKPQAGTIIPGNKYWFVLTAGLRDDSNTIRWHHDNDQRTPNRLSALLPNTKLDPTNEGDVTLWSRSVYGPTYAFSVFSSVRHILEHSDPESIKQYGLIEQIVDLPAFEDDATFQKALAKIIAYSAKPKRIYAYNLVTIPTGHLFFPGELVTVVDSKASLTSEKNVVAEIAEVTYNWDSSSNALGCRYADVHLIGFLDTKLDDYLDSKVC